MSTRERWGGSNNPGFGTGREARQKVVTETLPTAYFYVDDHADALRSWERLVEDLEYRTSERFGGKAGILGSFVSHHNGAYDYMKDCITGDIESLPKNKRYNRLFVETKEGYRRLDRKSLRYVFAGEGALAGEDPERVITLEEVQNWMVKQSSKQDGLIEGVSTEGVQNISPVTEIISSTDLVRYLMINRVHDGKHGFEAWNDQLDRAWFNTFTPEALRLAVCKLACGMAVMDLVVQESANVGIPVSIDYRPHEFYEYTQAKLPPLEQLWEQAHHLVTALAEPGNELLTGLFRNSL